MKMIKLLPLINPKVILLEMEEKELPDEFVVSERGYLFLQERVAALNKKAMKYKVPSMDIDVLKEEMLKVLRPEIEKANQVPIAKHILDDPNSWTLVKQYTLRIDGEPPKIEGYEFIARLEHTPTGNFIYTNPKSSVPNLPAEFKSLNQRCDICKTNRDRNDTFVIKMENDDPLRFPEKKAGDLLVVGRNCLAAFLPGLSIAGLIMFTKLIDNLEDDIKAAQEMKEGSGEYGGGGKYYEDPERLLVYLSATYLYTGTYISKKQANADQEMGKNTESTLNRALSEMRPSPAKDPQKAYPIRARMENDPTFKTQVEAMAKEFDAWVPTKDFDAMAAAKPDFADYIHNLQLVSTQDYLRGNHLGFFSGLFQLFIRDKKDAEKKADTAKQIADLPPSPVTFDDKMVKQRLRDIAKNAEIQRLSAGGMDEKAIKKAIRGREWGWDVTCKKITEYEKTQTFGYGDSGIGYRIGYRDEYGNDFLWFTGTPTGFEEGGKYTIDGTVTGYDPMNKYSNRPQTRINRVRIVKDHQNPNLPPQTDNPEAPGVTSPTSPTPA